METVYLTKVIKIGDSHGVIIPVSILRAYNWQRGDILVFGFVAPEQLFLKRISDKELRQIKPHGLSEIN